MLDRLPPQSLDSEQAALGAAMISRDAVDDLLANLFPSDFYLDAHGHIYEAIAHLKNREQPVDVLTVPEVLRDRGLLDQIGGVAYINTIAESVPTAAHQGFYVGAIEKKSVARKGIDVLGDGIARLYDQEDDPEIVLLETVEMLQAVNSQRSRWEVWPAAASFAEQRRQILNREQPRIIRLGQADLDNILKVKPGDLIVVAGASSGGKTATCLDWAFSAASIGVGVDLITLEMSREQYEDRLLAARADLPLTQITERLVSPYDYHLVEKWTGILERLPLNIVAKGVEFIESLGLYMRDTSRENGTQLIFIDQLQELDSHAKSDTETLKLGHIAKSIKRAATVTGMGAILMHQVNRKEGDSSRPSWRHLRGSGMIAEYADAVVMAHRPDRNKKDEPDECPMEWIVDKQRQGPTGIIRRTFRRSTQRMCDWLDEFNDEDIPPAKKREERLF